METLEEKIENLKSLNKEPLLEKAIELQTALDAAEKSIVEKDSIIEELNDELDNAGKRAVNKGFKVVKHDGESYGFTAPRFERSGRIYETNSISNDDPIVAELIGIGSGLLVKIVEPETEE